MRLGRMRREETGEEENDETRQGKRRRGRQDRRGGGGGEKYSLCRHLSISGRASCQPLRPFHHKPSSSRCFYLKSLTINIRDILNQHRLKCPHRHIFPALEYGQNRMPRDKSTSGKEAERQRKQ